MEENSDIIHKLEEITLDVNKSIDERINIAFEMRNRFVSGSDDEGLRNDVVIFGCLTEMITREDETGTHNLELLQLYTLLAETYVRLKDYCRLKDVAYGVLDILRNSSPAWKDIKETLPRIIGAIEKSVYNHALYELLLLYIKEAYNAGTLDSELSGEVRKLLRLKILLDDTVWLDRVFDKDLQSAVAGLLSSDDLVDIILHPQQDLLKKDPVEYTWEWENIYYDMEDRLEDIFADTPRHMGFCFRFWSVKRDLLKKEYNITWHSPGEMNPDVIFD